MQNVGAAWLMTSIAPTPTFVALVQTATSLPVFFFGLPAGVVADLVDRRRLLLVTQSWMLGAAGLLGFLTLTGRTTPWSLLILTFALGVGATLNGPAWQAIIPELVGADDLPAAIVINSVGFNLARAVGPAITGLLLAAFSPAIAFLLNAASFVGVIFVLYRWKREPVEGIAATERAMGAMRAGFRYVGNAPALQCLLVRTALFVVGASALWAMLPLLAKVELGGTAAGYGLMLGCMGAGSVIGAFLLARLRTRLSTDRMVVLGTLIFGSVSILLSVLSQFAVVCAAMLAAGGAWMISMSSLNTTAQTVVPDWVRARSLSFYLLVFQGVIAIASYLWGAVATRWGVRTTLLAAGVTLLASMAGSLKFKLIATHALDFSLVETLAQPPAEADVSLERGPVMVSVEYAIDSARIEEFAAAMQEMRRIRRRDGAVQWMMFQDIERAGRCVEMFLVETWEEHIRQHARATRIDSAIKERAYAFHLGPEAPVVTHWIARRG
jgi:MFS family permease